MIVIIISVFGFLIMLVVIGKINSTVQFNREVKALFSLSIINPNKKKFHHEQLFNLPEPVQRYFKHVLPEGVAYINCARLTHNGDFKTGLDKEWIKINGEQYFTTTTPGFIWKGTTAFFTARDMYIADKGQLIVSLFSIFKIINSIGKEIDQGELLRWIAESVWFPTNLLPSEHLRWNAIDLLEQV